MDKYVMAVLLLMPGFLTINTAEKLGKTHTKKTGVSLALEYATYTIVILLIAMGVSLLWAGGMTLQQVVNGELPLSFYAALVAVSLIASVASGAVWSLFLSDRVLAECNMVNKARGKNVRWEDIAVGFFNACSDPQGERAEFSVAEYPEYREEWNRVKEGEKDSYLYITEQTYVDASNGLVITETQYPPEWFNDGLKKASMEPETGEKAEHSDVTACSDADTQHGAQAFHFGS